MSFASSTPHFHRLISRFIEQAQQARNHVIPFEELEIGNVIGAGAFKEVRQGRWRGRTVAIALVRNVSGA